MKMRAAVQGMLLLLCPSWLLAGAPVIESFTASSPAVLPSGLVELTVVARDPDCAGTCSGGCGQTIRADLTTWTASDGLIVATNNGVTASPYSATAGWQAPAAEGSYTVRVSVSDSGTFLCGGRSTVTAELTVLVTTSTNRPPAIEAVSASPAQLYPGQTSRLSCVAADPDGDAVTSTWSVDSGSVAEGGGGSAVFTADGPALVTAICTATDTRGATASASLRLSVSDAFAETRLSSDLGTPQRLAVDSMGDVYVVDRAGGGVTVLNLFSGELVYRLPLRDAASVGVDWQGRLLVGGGDGARVLDRRGEVVLRLDPGEALGGVADVAVDLTNRRYAVLHHGAGRVVVYDAGGSRFASFGSTGDEPAQFRRPQGLAVTPQGALVVADSGHGQIKVFSPAGVPLASFGGLGSGAGKFVRLDDVGVDEDGVVYATDAFQSWVQAFTTDGTLREVLGTYGDELGQLKTPTGVAPSGSFRKLIVASLNSSSLQVFRLSGPAPEVRAPRATLSTYSLAFPAQATGTLSAPQDVTLHNGGDAPLGIRRVVVNGEFRQEDDCGAFLDPGQDCAFRLTHAPEAPGASVGSLVIETSAQPSLQIVSLSGEAFVPAEASLSPARLDFGEQAVGAASAPRAVTLTNGGTLSLAVLDIRVGPNFGLSHTCPSLLPAGASCAINVTFVPSQTGDIAGLLVVESGTTAGSQTVSLSGRGVSRSLSVAPESLDFGRRPVGVKSKGQVVAVSNVGSEPVQIGSVDLGGERPEQFLLEVDGCGQGRLSAGAACEIEAAFQPTEKGTFSATIRIASDAAGSPHLVSLKGWAGKPGGGLIFKDGFESGDLSAWSSVMPPETVVRVGAGGPAGVGLDFGAQPAGKDARRQTLRLDNAGRQGVDLGSLFLEGPGAQAFRLEADRCSNAHLEPGARCAVDLVFTVRPGASSAELHVPTSAGQWVVTVSGTGTEGLKR